MRAKVGFDLYKGFLVVPRVAAITSLTLEYFSSLIFSRVFSLKT